MPVIKVLVCVVYLVDRGRNGCCQSGTSLHISW